MAVGLSLFLIAIGAIARYAVADVWSGVDIPTVGLILMIVGAAGLVIALAQMVATQWPSDDRRSPPPRA